MSQALEVKEIPAVQGGDLLVFEQTDDQSYFIMDDSTTTANPDPPALGQTVDFTIGGVWLQEVNLVKLNFVCHLFGAVAYNSDFPDVETFEENAGWSYTIPFPVPPVAPKAEYDITVQGIAADGTSVFSIDTSFRF